MSMSTPLSAAMRLSFFHLNSAGNTILILGPRGVGKSTLARNILKAKGISEATTSTQETRASCARCTKTRAARFNVTTPVSCALS